MYAITRTILVVVLLGAAWTAQAQGVDDGKTVDNLRQAIIRTVTENPEIRASWFAFEASVEEQQAAKGGYYPSVDVAADAAHIRTDDPASIRDHYSRRGVSLTITQMLFDGMATRDEVARLRYSKLASYYRLREASEEVSLEVVVAYLDVFRFQKLVKLAEDNYVAHRTIYNQIEERTSGGVSRGVDLEQANARLALAEANLLTEMTNLYDVQVRFQRLTNLMPSEFLQDPVLSTSLIPVDRRSTLMQAYNTSPLMNAAIEEVRAMQEALNAKNAPMLPRFDLRFRRELDDIGEDISTGFAGNYNETAVEVVMTYNLYRGGADSANKRRLYRSLDRARELRIKACRDVRQNVMIAFNDVAALQEQLVYADRSQLAISKARVAYQAQFELGQRTLLNQLDTENEFFDAHRSVVNAETDMIIAQATTLAKMGLLLAATEINELGTEARAGLNLDRDNADNAMSTCPVEDFPTALSVDKEALFAELMTKNSRFVPAGPNKAKAVLNVNFAHDSSVIVSDYDSAIDDALVQLKETPEVSAVLEGHTDSTGTEEYNQWLSERRANAVRDQILSKSDIAEDRLTIKGYGESAPIADNATEEGRQMNRRTELLLENTAPQQ